MSLPTQKPATTPIPVQLSETEFTTFILPHLSTAILILEINWYRAVVGVQDPGS